MKKGTKTLWVVFALVLLALGLVVGLYALAGRSTFGRGFVAGARSVFTLEHWVLRSKGCLSSGILAPEPGQADALRQKGNERAAAYCESSGLCTSETVMCSASFKKETITCTEVAAVHREYAKPDAPFQVLVLRGLKVVCHELRTSGGDVVLDIKRVRDAAEHGKPTP